MATTRPFSYNTGSTIDGTTQLGNLAIGVSDQDYSLNPGGVKWWMGPDEELGYVIAHEVPTGDHPTPTDVDSFVGFWRSDVLTEQSFVDLFNIIPPRVGQTKFTSGNSAKTWLNDNGYWTSYGENLPTPTPTSTSGLPTATPTPTPTATNIPATPTPTSTDIPATSTPTPTPTETEVPATPTPTATEVPPTPTATEVPPTPTATEVPPTPTTSPTPTATPEMSTLNIEIGYSIPNVVFNSVTYTSNTTISVVKNQQYTVICGSGNFDTFEGTGLAPLVPNASNIAVTVTGNTATLRAVSRIPTPTSTPTPTATNIQPTNTPTPTATNPDCDITYNIIDITPTPTATNPACDVTYNIVDTTPTPTPIPPTPTATESPLDFTLTAGCNPQEIILTNFSGGSGQWDWGVGAFASESEALNTSSWNNIAQSYNTLGFQTDSDGTFWVAVRDRNNTSNKIAKSVTISCVTPTPTPTNTPTGTPTPTPVPDPTATPVPPTPTPTDVNTCSGIPYTLTNAWGSPTSGSTLWVSTSGSTASNQVNRLAISSPFFINKIDSDGVDRTSYFGAVTGSTFTVTICQNGNSAIYSGITGSITYNGTSYFEFDATKLSLIQSSPVSAFTFNELVYFNIMEGGSPAPTSSRPTSTPTGTPTPTPTATEVPSPTNTPTPTATDIPPTPTATDVPPTATPVSSTPTPTPTTTSASAPMTVTIYESGSNVVMSASGTVNLSGLTLVNSNFGPIGGGGLGINTATFICGSGSYASTYSGFTTTPSNFGTGSGAAPSSASGNYFGVIIDQNPPYLLVLPTGYTSGANISSTQTFNNTSLSTLGLTNGTYTYTWSGGSIDVVVGGTPGPTGTPAPTSSGAGWNFFVTANTVINQPPLADGEILFYTTAGGPPRSTYNPNAAGANYVMIYKMDSAGTDYTTQFTNLQTNGGTINITQNGNTATYVANSGGQVMFDPAGFLLISTSLQTVTVGSPFTFDDTITISFNSGPTSTPTPTPGPTSTPTPTPTSTSTPTPTPTATEVPPTPTTSPTPTATPTPTPIPSNIIVAAGGVNALGYSYDGGDNWTNSTNGGTFFSQPALTVATDGNMFVAGGTTSSNSLAYSYDGDSWTGATNGSTMFTTNVRGVAYGGDKWVAVGISSGAAKFAYSTDGITWTAASNSNAIGSVPNSVAYNGSRWVAVGSSPAGGSGNRTTIAYSDDGISWTASANSGTIFTGSSLNVAWGGDKWVAVGTGANRIAYSTDGITWSGSTSGNSVITGTGYGIAYNGSQWVAAGQGTNALAYSSDGITWSGATNGNTIFTFQSYCVTWAGTKWVAGGLGTNQLATSTDGITWNVTTNGNTIMNNRVQGLAAKY